MSKAGRYAKNHGTHWRSRAQQVGLAAEGLNTRGESYCADVQSDGLVHDAFLAALCGGKVDRKALTELCDVGWWVRVEGGHEIVGYLERNISKADDEARRNGGKARVAKHRGGAVTPEARNDVGNAVGNDTCNALQNAQRAPLPLTLSVVDRPKTQDPRNDLPSPAVAGSADQDPERGIAELAARYPASLVADTRAAIASTRRGNKLAPSVWRATLESLAKYDTGIAIEAMRAWLADDLHIAKGERYLVGFARNGAKRAKGKPPTNAWRAPVTTEAYAASATTLDDDEAALAALTPEDHARMSRWMGGAHG